MSSQRCSIGYSIAIAAAILTLFSSGAKAALTVSPASATVAPQGVKQFSYTVDSASNSSSPQISWVLWPKVGTLSASGLYTAPSSITTPTVVKVVVIVIPASSSLPNLIASALVTLNPPTAVKISPTTASLGAKQSTQFSASIANTTNTAVQWSLNPNVGTVSSTGLYTAPISVTSQQTVQVIATSVADSSKNAIASVTLTPPVVVTASPSTVSLTAGQSKQLAASVTGSTNSAVTWSISPAVGNISSSGLYTAPASISSQQIITASAKSAADPTKSGSVSITLKTSSLTGSVLLPIEVLGSAGTTQTVQVNVPSVSGLSGPLNLWIRIHGLEYETQASVQVNSGSWIALNSQNTVLQGLATKYGGIGGGFSTLGMTVSLPVGLVQAGTNSIAFRFNGSDGNSSGFRVLGLNIQLPNGSPLIDSATFAQVDPSTWTPPLTGASDLAAGEKLWRSGSIVQPLGNGGSTAIKAHCGDCHAQDGRDLKYFNYSNTSIHTRAVFHGLTDTQGDQIASYIRSLSAPAPAQARPWNPPYQPGPGLDSKPVTEWSAGAGIDAVLASDGDMLPYVAPSLTQTDFDPNGNSSMREIPIALQLLDWNHWLPKVHPIDAWGSTFPQSQLNATYQTVTQNLQPGNVQLYQNYKYNLGSWAVDRINFEIPIQQSNPNWSDPSVTSAMYSIGLWQQVKAWEIFQQFGLEGLAQDVFGPQADARAWFTSLTFLTSPHLQGVPFDAPGVGNGALATMYYHNYAWYHMQMILNNSNKQLECNAPIDFPYVYGSISTLSQDSPQQGMLMLEVYQKALQISNNGGSVAQGCILGWNPGVNNPAYLVQPGNQYLSDLSSTTRTQLYQSYLTNWYTAISAFGPQEFYKGNYTATGDTINPGLWSSNLPSNIAYMIPQYKYAGVDPQLMSNITDWAAKVWPNFDWNKVRNASCSPNDSGIIDCDVYHLDN